MKNTTDTETRKLNFAKLFLLVALSAATFAATAQNSTRTQSGNFTSLTQSKTTTTVSSCMTIKRNANEQRTVKTNPNNT